MFSPCNHPLKSIAFVSSNDNQAQVNSGTCFLSNQMHSFDLSVRLIGMNASDWKVCIIKKELVVVNHLIACLMHLYLSLHQTVQIEFIHKHKRIPSVTSLSCMHTIQYDAYIPQGLIDESLVV